jgi:hypothetical protein
MDNLKTNFANQLFEAGNKFFPTLHHADNYHILYDVISFYTAAFVLGNIDAGVALFKIVLGDRIAFKCYCENKHIPFEDMTMLIIDAVIDAIFDMEDVTKQSD